MIHRGTWVLLKNEKYLGTGIVLRVWPDTGMLLVAFEGCLPHEVTIDEVEAV
jgi:hypothetical protein